MQDAAPVLEHDATRLSQRHAATVTQQKRLMQLNLKLAHIAGEQRLSNAEQRRRTCEAAHFGDANERFDLFQIHGIV